MATCWRCAGTISSDADRCPDCGALPGGELLEIDVFDDGARTTSELVDATDSASPAWLIVAALAVLGGFVAFFALTGDGSDDAADPADASDAAIDEPDPEEPAIEFETILAPDGDIVGPLQWETAIDGVGFPLATLDVGDSVFVYTTDSPSPFQNSGTVHAYERVGYQDWRDRGPIVDAGARITAIAESPGGAVAVGEDSAGQPTMWDTTDGLRWDSTPLAEITEPGMAGARAHTIAATDDTVMVLGRPPDPWELVTTAVRERFGELDTSLSTDFSGFGDIVTVRGPFGIVVGEIDATELGVDLNASFDEQRDRHVLWIDEGDGWTTTVDDGALIDLFSHGDELVRLSLEGGSGPRMSTYDDGEWSDATALDAVWQVRPWGDRLVGPNHWGSITVIDPEAGVEQELEVPGHVSSSNISWLDAGVSGLVVAESVWPTPTVTPDPERVIIVRDGFALTAADGGLRLRYGDEIDLTFSSFWQSARDRYDVDLATESVTFLGDDGERLATFSIGELDQLQSLAVNRWDRQDTTRVLFTPDGETWHGGELDLGAERTAFMWPTIVGDRIVATVLTDVEPNWNPTGDHTFRILEAALPE